MDPDRSSFNLIEIKHGRNDCLFLWRAFINCHGSELEICLGHRTVHNLSEIKSWCGSWLSDKKNLLICAVFLHNWLCIISLKLIAVCPPEVFRVYHSKCYIYKIKRPTILKGDRSFINKTLKEYYLFYFSIVTFAN